jgi:hypothetical protein
VLVESVGVVLAWTVTVKGMRTLILPVRGGPKRGGAPFDAGGELACSVLRFGNFGQGISPTQYRDTYVSSPQS